MRACLSGLNSDSYAQLLAIPAVSTCTELVLAGETAVSEAAVGVLALLCTTHEGKALAVAAQAQRSFLYIINGSISLPVLTDAVAGLLSMSVNTEGKHAVIRAGAADALAAHLDNPNELLRLQVLQAVASIAEEPSGREQVRLGRDCAREAVSFRRAANSPAARACLAAAAHGAAGARAGHVRSLQRAGATPRGPGAALARVGCGWHYHLVDGLSLFGWGHKRTTLECFGQPMSRVASGSHSTTIPHAITPALFVRSMPMSFTSSLSSHLLMTTTLRGPEVVNWRLRCCTIIAFGASARYTTSSRRSLRRCQARWSRWGAARSYW